MSGTPSYPWSEGDPLFASALNDAIANSAAYGPFLPLSGGTVTGPIVAPIFATPGSTTTLSGSAIPPRIGEFSVNWYGSTTVANNSQLATVCVGAASDNLSVLDDRGARCELLVSSNYGGDNFSGGRTGVMVQMGLHTQSPNNAYLVALAGVVDANSNVGGVSSGFGITQFGKGQIFGSNAWARLVSGATYYSEVVGAEIDFSIGAGASAMSFVGLQVVLTSDHQTKAANNNSNVGILVSAQGGVAPSASLNAAYLVGGFDAQWPLDPGAGYVFRTAYSQNGVDPHCAGGIDLLYLIPDGTSGIFGGGFTYRGPGTIAASAMDKSGGWKIGNGFLNPVAGGLNIDVSLFVLTGTPTVAAGGTGYATNDMATDGYGNLFRITAAAGVVTSVVVLQRSEGSTVTHAGVVATSAASRAGSRFGVGLTLNETWTQSGRALSIQPTAGGSLGFHGATPVTKQTGVAVTIAAVHAALTNLGLIAP